MKHNERLQALKILISLLQDKSSLSQLLPESGESSAMTKALCFGFCRHYIRLEAIADCLMDKRPKSLDVWVAILMGLYQLQYMRQPDYAVVQETVALLQLIKRTWAKGLVNAILRRFCREQEAILASLAQNEAFLYGQPKWLLKQLKKDWPDDWQAIALANDAHPPLTLRINKQKTKTEEYLKCLAENDIDASVHPVAPKGITLATACDVTSLPGFSEGLFSVQDGAAQLAASLLSLQPGLRVLDACCAPGGKTCHILESEPNLASVVALDVDAKRLKRVKDNLERLHLKAEVVQGDASFPETWWDNRLFDRILLDAPCSATGVIRRHPDIKLLRTPADILAITQIQKQMLHALWPLLAPGGLMLYATCSVMKAENEQQLGDFITSHADCKLVLGEQTWGRSTGHGRQILPGEQGMDGFFYSLLQKSA